MRKAVKQIAIISAVTAAATIGVATPALAADYATYINRRSGACLDSNTAGEAYTLGCNSGSNQQWDLQFISGTSYYLKNRATGRCLDGNSAGNVYTLSCNGGENQRWRRAYLDGTPYDHWINVKTGKCLTGSVYTNKRVVYQSVCETSSTTDGWDRLDT